MSLELGDAGTLLLAVLKSLGTLGLQFIFQPFDVATSEFELLLDRVLAVLGTAELTLGILLGLLQRGDFSCKLDIPLVLLCELFRKSRISLVVRLDDGQVGTI